VADAVWKQGDFGKLACSFAVRNRDRWTIRGRFTDSPIVEETPTAHDTSARQKTRARCRLKAIRSARPSGSHRIGELVIPARLLHCNEFFCQFFASKS